MAAGLDICSENQTLIFNLPLTGNKNVPMLKKGIEREPIARICFLFHVAFELVFFIFVSLLIPLLEKDIVRSALIIQNYMSVR